MSQVRRMARQRRFEREEVLDRAVALFWRRGFGATSVQDLVDATGVNRASLYATFGGKRALFLEAVDRYLDAVAAARLAPLDALDAGLDAIRRYFDDLIDFSLGEGRRLGCLLTNSAVELAPRDAEAAAKVAAGMARVEAAFERALRRARERGEVDPGADPRELAAFLINTVQGLRVMARLNPDRGALRRVVEVALRAVR